MGMMKRRMEAEEEDYNREIRICSACGERIEYEGDASVTSFQYEYSFTGPFTTIWHCGCNDIEKEKCVRCGKEAPDELIPLCGDCLVEYEGEIETAREALRCSRCGCRIPISGEIKGTLLTSFTIRFTFHPDRGTLAKCQDRPDSTHPERFIM